MCGGTSVSSAMVLTMYGLSPRVRGNLVGLSSLRVKGGSIPACAGEPAYEYKLYHGEEVYPRVCGGTCHASGVMARE